MYGNNTYLPAELAQILTKEQYKKDSRKARFVWLCVLLRPLALWAGLRFLPGFWLVLFFVIHYALWLISGYEIYRFSAKLYSFMDGDLRSTNTYSMYRGTWKWVALSLALDILAAVNFASPVWFWIFVAAETVVLGICWLGVNAQYGLEFAPGNGRYTFNLQVSLAGRYTDDELRALIYSKTK